MFRLGIFQGPLLCDIILSVVNIINHLYKNLSNSIYNIFILQAKWYLQTADVNPETLPTRTLPNANSIHKHFAHKELCPQQSDRVGCLPTIEIFLTTDIFIFYQSINQSFNQSILHLDNYSGYIVLKETNINSTKVALYKVCKLISLAFNSLLIDLHSTASLQYGNNKNTRGGQNLCNEECMYTKKVSRKSNSH